MFATAGMQEIKLGMSNCYHEIEDGFEDALRESPNKVFGRHAGWDFNARVWFDGEKFNSEVWVYCIIQETLSADSLSELFKITNDKYGWD